jgi:hypothetical protein
MMSFLLCQECFGWVQPHNSHCPDCLAIVDPGQPDPSYAQLRSTLGDVLLELGEVRVSRSLLPSRGLLYATTKGLYFLPHRIEEVLETKEEQVNPSILWSLAAVVWWPLRLVIPLLRTKRLRQIQVQVYCPQCLTAAESDRLPELLMDNPGAFFIPNRAVQFAERKRGRWIVERLQGGRVVFKLDGDSQEFDERLHDLTRSPEWQHLKHND